jgi:hypothetical protein
MISFGAMPRRQANNQKTERYRGSSKDGVIGILGRCG